MLATYLVGPDGEGVRVDAWLAQRDPALPSRAAARKAARRGRVCVDGAVVESGRFLHAGQTVALLEPVGPLPPVPSMSIPVLWEDEHLALVEKPPGVLVNGPKPRTLEKALRAHLAPTEVPGALRHPRPAHRLDAKTGGLVAVAKTAPALAGLSRIFRERRVQKRYRAIGVGHLDHDRIEVTEPVEGRASHSTVRVVSRTRALRGDWLTTVDLVPHTGRQHQLRRHMLHLGVPILGDHRYFLDTNHVLRGKGLFLWAVRLQFDHPITGEPVAAEVGEPAKFQSLRDREARRWQKHRGAPASEG